MMRCRNLIFVVIMLASTACTSVQMKPYGNGVQTLLVLPVKVDNSTGRKNIGFRYQYDIINTDGEGLVAQALFRFPNNLGYVMIDSLPPGNYSVRKIKILTSSGGSLVGSGKDSTRLDYRFRLEEGKITIFDRSLVIYKRFHPQYYTLTTSKIEEMSMSQFRDIYSKLEKQPEFAQWQVTNLKHEAKPELQGEWRVDNKLQTDNDCGWNLSKLEVQGSFFNGSGLDQTGDRIVLDGIVSNRASARVEATQRGRKAGSIWGNFIDGEFRGYYRNSDNCRQLLRLLKVTQPATEPAAPAVTADSAPDGATPAPTAAIANATDHRVDSPEYLFGRYRSEIVSHSAYAFKLPYREVQITLKREGNRIHGSDEAGEIKIFGELEGDRIRYYVLPSIVTGFYDITGEWRVSSDGATLEGDWQDSRGDDPGRWNLYRLEQ